MVRNGRIPRLGARGRALAGHPVPAVGPWRAPRAAATALRAESGAASSCRRRPPARATLRRRSRCDACASRSKIPCRPHQFVLSLFFPDDIEAACVRTPLLVRQPFHSHDDELEVARGTEPRRKLLQSLVSGAATVPASPAGCGEAAGRRRIRLRIAPNPLRKQGGRKRGTGSRRKPLGSLNPGAARRWATSTGSRSPPRPPWAAWRNRC